MGHLPCLKRKPFSTEILLYAGGTEAWRKTAVLEMHGTHQIFPKPTVQAITELSRKFSGLCSTAVHHGPQHSQAPSIPNPTHQDGETSNTEALWSDNLKRSGILQERPWCPRTQHCGVFKGHLICPNLFPR